jgi:beta-lactamase class A
MLTLPFTSFLLVPQASAPPDLEGALRRAIAASGTEVAVAYRTLDGRNEILIDTDKVFHAASTMHVPIMIEATR